MSSTTETNNLLVYNTSTYELQYNSSKTFIIDHPTETDRYLIHGCLEGPETGVYYRGKSAIVCDNVVVHLPNYVKNFAFDFTVHLTAIGKANQLYYTEIENGSFTVYGEPGEFSWIVHGSRLDITPEPYKTDVIVHGDGPYRWYQQR